MGEFAEALGSASAHWNDYVGTAAADDADALLNARSLYQLAGMDRERWTIVGIDIDRWESDHRVTVYAFDRRRHPVETYSDLLQLAERTGQVPVTAFRLDDPAQVEAFRLEAFKRMAIRLTARPLTEVQLTVDDRRELHPQT